MTMMKNDRQAEKWLSDRNNWHITNINDYSKQATIAIGDTLVTCFLMRQEVSRYDFKKEKMITSIVWDEPIDAYVRKFIMHDLPDGTRFLEGDSISKTTLIRMVKDADREGKL